MKKFVRLIIYLRLLYKVIFRKIRIIHYQLLSNSKNIKGRPILFQPIVVNGIGQIVFGKNIKFGVENAPDYYSSYGFIDVRNIDSKIEFGDDIWINNHFCAISEGAGIYIGDKTIIGVNVSIMDTDFHHIDPDKRMLSGYPTGFVNIGKNVWIGNNVMILKNSEIGDNSIIAAGAVVSGKFPSNVIIGGVPAKVIKNL